MDKFQAAFEVLYFLASVDGYVDKREVDVIFDFLNANFGKINFDPKKVVDVISSMTSEGMVDELEHAALIFKNSSSAQDRMTLLDFALDLIAADGKIKDQERDLFFILGNTWNIDLERYFKSKGLS
ncbi:MAG: TerB family tellurite resistance protein [candidate division KSB1 bacterium]|nr:TerB family tellurite resistance protein [candidate division KSB1 bacterium]MDZ7312975.1 TerB family tellurite resistance protein [candidate division KSB1 bacterium]MDZ7344977.1 TerB family tellurite resistance protein [candidate division KSB1 bacterium]